MADSMTAACLLMAVVYAALLLFAVLHGTRQRRETPPVPASAPPRAAIEALHQCERHTYDAQVRYCIRGMTPHPSPILAVPGDYHLPEHRKRWIARRHDYLRRARARLFDLGYTLDVADDGIADVRFADNGFTPPEDRS
jgi:hypothetical protein